jgi:hypothetical protein
MDLDPDNNTVVLAFEYSLNEADFYRFKIAFNEFAVERSLKYELKYNTSHAETAEEKLKIEESKRKKQESLFYDFFKKNHTLFFKPSKKTLFFNPSTLIEDDTVFTELSKEKFQLETLINFRIIGAKRDVSNKDNDKTLSLLSSKYYEKREGLEKDSEAIKHFKDTLTETDDQLDIVYDGLFKNVIDKVGKFGGIKNGDSIIKIISTLQHKELLKGNTTVMYDHNETHALPEHYNGLGYMNLIGMIFEIEVLLTDFRRENKENEKPADINLLFIEEPEAHTHPQMQYVFIKNIKDILMTACAGDNKGNTSFNLQTIITTHSSHITAESQFNDIKYFLKKNSNQIEAKNLRDLEKEYDKDGEISNYKFLKQYLTLDKAELFFADKAIFIEGDTERILLPAMMKKIDQELPENPLLSQNISIVEVGAYSHIFEKFINFVGIKSLIISDIDSAKKILKEGKSTVSKCPIDDDVTTITTNASLIYFHNKSDIKYFKELGFNFKILRKSPRYKPPRWVSNKKGKLLIVFQTGETNAIGDNYHARSFEDAFFHLNKQFVADNVFNSLKHKDHFSTAEMGPYDLSEKCIGSKPSFAMEILLNSKPSVDNKEFANWEIPAYIKEGLIWLKKN